MITYLRTPGLKTGMDYRGQGWKRLWKETIFWSEIGSGFGEPGGTPPPQIPRSTPPEDSLNIFHCSLSPNDDQDQFSPNNIHTLSRDKLWELIKWSLKRKYLDLLSNSRSYFFKEMYGVQFGEIVLDTAA